MNNLQMLEVLITSLPDEYGFVRDICLKMLMSGELLLLRVYSQGLRDMAIHLTSEEALVGPLTEIGRLLK